MDVGRRGLDGGGRRQGARLWSRRVGLQGSTGRGRQSDRQERDDEASRQEAGTRDDAFGEVIRGGGERGRRNLVGRVRRTLAEKQDDAEQSGGREEPETTKQRTSHGRRIAFSRRFLRKRKNDV